MKATTIKTSNCRKEKNTHLNALRYRRLALETEANNTTQLTLLKVMASKHFITFTVIAAMAISQANAQLGLAILNGLLDAFHIHGNVNCNFGEKTNEKVAAFPSKI